MVKLIDLETVALPESEVRAMLPPFDEAEARASVPRNYRKPEAISGWVEEQRASYGSDIVEKAALNPLYSRVVVVTAWDGSGVKQSRLLDDDEPALVESALMFLSHLESSHVPAREFLDGGLVAGWNIAWDLSYLLKRAWILGIPVPKSVFNPLERYPIPSRFIDLMRLWQGGDYKAPYTSLDSALRALGLPPKTHDGSEFGKLWVENREEACAYARAEMESLKMLAERLGVL